MRITQSARWILASLLASALAAACDSGPEGPELTGTRVLLTDAPFPFDQVSRVDVYIVSVDASETADTTDPGREWTNIVSPRQRFNLLDLQRGATALVGEGDLPAGQYEAVRLVIDTDSSSISYRTGGSARIQWPVAGELALHALVEEPVDVPESGGEIVIDFDVGRSFWVNEWRTDSLGPSGGGPDFFFISWIRAVNEAATGGIVGRLLGDVDGDGTPEPVEDATVSVLRGDVLAGPLTWWTVATGATDGNGDFKIDFLLPGTYILRATPPSALQLGAATVTDVDVILGAETNVPLLLSSAEAASVEIVGPQQVEVGHEIVLRAVVLDASGDTLTGQPISWLYGPQGVADVYDQGGGIPTGEFALVKGLQTGVVSILASSFDLFDSTSVTVVDPNAAPVHTVELTPAAATLAVYDSLMIAVTLRDEAGNVLGQRAVGWEVSDSAVVQLIFTSPSFATVSAVGAGTATVTATSEGKSGSATVTVNNE
jgi:hypothetical protein